MTQTPRPEIDRHRMLLALRNIFDMHPAPDGMGANVSHFTVTEQNIQDDIEQLLGAPGTHRSLEELKKKEPEKTCVEHKENSYHVQFKNPTVRYICQDKRSANDLPLTGDIIGKALVAALNQRIEAHNQDVRNAPDTPEMPKRLIAPLTFSNDSATYLSNPTTVYYDRIYNRLHISSAIETPMLLEAIDALGNRQENEHTKFDDYVRAQQVLAAARTSCAKR